MMPGLGNLVAFQGAAVGGGGLMASASPNPVNKTQSTTGGAPVVMLSPTTTVTPSGGVPGFTYAWAFVSGDAAITATAPAAAATAFTASVAVDERKTAVFRCTVTDANGATTTVDVDVSLHLVGLS